MFEIGRVCVKLAGREAGKKCVIIKEIDKNFVLIDGNVKRRKANKDHLMPLAQMLDIKEGASTETVKEAMKKAGILEEKVRFKKKEAKGKKAERPKHIRKGKTPEEKEAIRKARIEDKKKSAEKRKEEAEKKKKEEKKEEKPKAKPAKKVVKKE